MRPAEGLGFIRVMMSLGSMAPLFLLLAIRGVPKIDGQPIIQDDYYISICAILIAVPNLFLAFKIFLAGKISDNRELTVGKFTDNRQDLIVYLLALMIPMYQNNYSTVRDIYASIAIIVFILYLFVYTNMHYLNFAFAFSGYRVYTVQVEDVANEYSGNKPFVLITKRHSLRPPQTIIARRLSDTVYIEYENPNNTAKNDQTS